MPARFWIKLQDATARNCQLLNMDECVWQDGPLGPWGRGGLDIGRAWGTWGQTPILYLQALTGYRVLCACCSKHSPKCNLGEKCFQSLLKLTFLQNISFQPCQNISSAAIASHFPSNTSVFHTTCFITENFLECLQTVIQWVLEKVLLLHINKGLKLNFWGCKDMISIWKCSVGYEFHLHY